MCRPADRGMALLVVVMTLLLVMAIGGALVLTTSPDTLIAENFRQSRQALYTADAAAEWAMADLPAVVEDWPTVLNTAVRSSFVDGAPTGRRTLPDAATIDLDEIVQENAAWKPYAYGLFRDLLPPTVAAVAPSPFYVIVFVAADSTSPDRLRVRTDAFGPRGAHKAVEICILRDPAGVHAVSWAEIR